jgi:membrane-associated phospholipid phosphatase
MSGGERRDAANGPATRPAGGWRLGIEPADRVVLGYAAFVAAVVLWSRPPRWPLLVLAQLALIGGVVFVGWRAQRSPTAGWRFLHRWYPVMLLLVLYPQAGALRHLLVARGFDPLVLRWEDALFPGRWWSALPPRLPLAASEAVHAAYFSYYVLLFLPALLAERRARRQVGEYVGVLIFTLLLHFAASFLFPVDGPPRAHAAAAAPGAFGGLVALAYRLFDRGGLAFPSTHVAATVVAAWYSARFYPDRRWLYALWAASITASTVLGSFHYTIDAAAGLLSGAACAAIGAFAAIVVQPPEVSSEKCRAGFEREAPAAQSRRPARPRPPGPGSGRSARTSRGRGRS